MPDVDGKVKLELSYFQIGMIYASLNIVSSRINRSGATLTQIELNDLIRDINEQVQEQVTLPKMPYTGLVPDQKLQEGTGIEIWEDY